MDSTSTIKTNLEQVRQVLGDSGATLIVVSKYVGVEKILEAFKYGVTEFGESRIQDALKKQEALPPDLARYIHWHFIGHLQSNKVRKALGRFVLIHSIDSLDLAKELSDAAVKMGLVQDVLLQVKLMEDPAKSGFNPEDLKKCFYQIYQFPGLRVNGLMTMTPLCDDKELWKSCFTGLKKLKEELENTCGITLNELSMGMSDDYEVALECGATMVRVGRAIFEKNEN